MYEGIERTSLYVSGRLYEKQRAYSYPTGLSDRDAPSSELLKLPQIPPERFFNESDVSFSCVRDRWR